MHALHPRLLPAGRRGPERVLPCEALVHVLLQGPGLPAVSERRSAVRPVRRLPVRPREVRHDVLRNQKKCADPGHDQCRPPRTIPCGSGLDVNCCATNEVCCKNTCCPPRTRCTTVKGKAFCAPCTPPKTKKCGTRAARRARAAATESAARRARSAASRDHCCPKAATCCGETCCPKGKKCCGDHCCRDKQECCDKGCCPKESRARSAGSPATTFSRAARRSASAARRSAASRPTPSRTGNAARRTRTVATPATHHAARLLLPGAVPPDS